MVDVKASEAATALAEGKVDVVMSVPFSSDLLTRASIAGTYITDGPAFFIATEGTASVEPSLTLDTVHGPVGTQEESVAYWKLVSEFDTAGVTTFPTLRDAIVLIDDQAAVNMTNYSAKGTVGAAAIVVLLLALLPTRVGPATAQAVVLITRVVPSPHALALEPRVDPDAQVARTVGGPCGRSDECRQQDGDGDPRLPVTGLVDHPGASAPDFPSEIVTADEGGGRRWQGLGRDRYAMRFISAFREAQKAAQA